MFKTSILATTPLRVHLKDILKAFNEHTYIRVKKLNGDIVGPGHIAIMYGDVAFRMYSQNVSRGSDFVRLEEVAEILPGATA